MEPIAIEQAAEAMAARIIGAAEGQVRSLCTDTRQGADGALFFALRGEKTDGHRFVAQAFEGGAAAAVVERVQEGVRGPQLVVTDTLRALGELACWYRSRFRLPLVAITGSVGKTSTKEMIACVLRTRFHVLASEKNFNNEIGRVDENG